MCSGGPVGRVRGRPSANVLGMPPTPRQRILPIEQLNTEWRTLGRSASAVYALHHLAEHDADLAALVHGPGSGSPGSPPACPTPCDLIDHMRQAAGSRGREEAAALIRLMLRQSPLDPLIVRCLIQALLPGLLTIAARLRWGQGGDWDDGSEFFSETLSTTWMVVSDWAGQDRPYAVLDLLSAIRCRMRRRLFRARDLRQQQLPLTSGVAEPRARNYGNRPRGPGAHPHRTSPGRDASRRCRSALRPSCPGLFHRRAGPLHRTGPPIALRTPRSGPASALRVTAEFLPCPLAPKVTPWPGTMEGATRWAGRRLAASGRTGGPSWQCRSPFSPWSRPRRAARRPPAAERRRPTSRRCTTRPDRPRPSATATTTTTDPGPGPSTVTPPTSPPPPTTTSTEGARVVGDQSSTPHHDSRRPPTTTTTSHRPRLERRRRRPPGRAHRDVGRSATARRRVGHLPVHRRRVHAGLGQLDVVRPPLAHRDMPGGHAGRGRVLAFVSVVIPDADGPM